VPYLYNKKKPQVIWEEPYRRPSCRQSRWLQWKVPNFPPPRTALSLRWSPPKSNMPIQSPPNYHPQPCPNPRSHFARMPNADWQTDRQTKMRCGALWNVTERCTTLRNACRALQNACGLLRCIAMHCGNIAEHFWAIAIRCWPLWCVAVHYGALWKRCRSLAHEALFTNKGRETGPLECFQTIAVHYDTLWCK